MDVALRYCTLAEFGQFTILFEELFDTHAQSFDASFSLPYEHGLRRIIGRWSSHYAHLEPNTLIYNCTLLSVHDSHSPNGHFTCRLSTQVLSGGQKRVLNQKEVFCLVSDGKVLLEKCLVEQLSLAIN